MLDFNYNDFPVEFKKRLSAARKEKNLTQQELANLLKDSDRTRVASWESKKSKTIPKTQDIPAICKILDIDPNYLLGFSTITNENDEAIAKQLGLDSKNVRLLRNNASVSGFINYLLETPKFHALLKQIQRIYIHGFFSESIETTFSSSAIRKLEKAFNKFSHEVFPIDMDENTFMTYVKDVFPWNEKTASIDDFVQSIVIDPRYYTMLATNPAYLRQTNAERYANLIYDFSKASFNHLMKNQLAELAKHEITHIFSEIVQDYIDITVTAFKKRENDN